MKKMILCLLAILPVFFMSCSSDDNDENGGMSTKQALDKIKKDFGLDLRTFRDAVIFRIISEIANDTQTNDC